jgi:hypothetical protein
VIVPGRLVHRPLALPRRSRLPTRATTYGVIPPPTLPSWVPAAGGVATYVQGGGVLTNNWRAVHDPTSVGYDQFHSRKITDYSAFFLHPTWRDFGGMVMWGGGHSATNYNGVTMMSFLASTIEFECVVTPTDWQIALDTGNLSTNSEVNSYGEAQTSGTPHTPLRLVGPHSYGSGDVVDGKFVQVRSAAWGYSNIGDEQAAHELDLTNPATAATARAWVRRTNSVGAWAWNGAPSITRYVPPQDRIFTVARGGGGPYSMMWFDLASNAWTTGSGTGFNYPESTTETGGLLWCESRDLLLCVYRNSSGNVVIQYANVASGVSQPALGGTATLSATLAVPVEWSGVSWCEDSQRVLIFGVTSNTDKVYEVEIPTTLSDTWTVTNHTLAGGATIVPPVLSVYGKSMDYNPATKCIVVMQEGIKRSDMSPNTDRVTVYRPRNT